MRLLAVTWTSDRSEAALWLGLKARGWEIEVVCDPAEPRAAEFRAAGLAVTTCAIRSKLDWRTVRLVRERIKTFGADLIYAPTTKGLSISLQATRRPLTSTFHPPPSTHILPPSTFPLPPATLTPSRRGLRVPVIGFRGTLGRISRWDPANWLTYFHPRCARVVCLSNAVLRHLTAHGVSPKRLVRVYLGQDPSWYVNLPRAERSPPALLPPSTFHPPPSISHLAPAFLSRAALGIAEDAFLVGFTGALRPIKGVDVLIGALGRLKAAVPVTALLVGKVRDPRLPGMAAQAMRAASDAGRRLQIIFTGARSDAAALAGLCDLFVMPTLRDEGLSRSVMEAMAQGVPAVVSAVGGLPELVEDGICGAVVPPRDETALAAALSLYAASPALCRSHGAGARERIAQRFHIDRMIDEMDRIFREVRQGTCPVGAAPLS